MLRILYRWMEILGYNLGKSLKRRDGLKIRGGDLVTLSRPKTTPTCLHRTVVLWCSNLEKMALRRMKRVGKKATKFQYSSTYQSIILECQDKKWYVNYMYIILLYISITLVL